MLKRLLFLVLLCSSTLYAAEFEGCYLVKDDIASAVTGETEERTSYMHVTRVAEDYFVEGTLFGANFHVCSVGSTSEDVAGPLKMTREGDVLVYRESDEEYDFSCELSVSRKGNMLVFKDEGGQCSGGVFFCGARIGLNGIEIPKVDGECPTENQ
ncbi:hypothetical protein ACUALS_19180 [Vibrio sp. NH-7]